MSPVDDGVSMFISLGFRGTLKFYEYTDWLVFGTRPCYHSTAHNMKGILFIFGTAIGLSKSMNLFGTFLVLFLASMVISMILWQFDTHRLYSMLLEMRLPRVPVPGTPLQWRHNGLDGVSNHQPHHCLLSGVFGRRSKKTSKLRVTDLCAGNSPVTGEFPAQMASNAENVSIWWRHHGILWWRYKHGNTFPMSLWWPLLIILNWHSIPY